MSIVADHLASLDEPNRSVIGHLYDVATAAIGEPSEKVSYGLPALAFRGKAVIAIVPTKSGISLYPFSGKVVARMKDRYPDLGVSAGNGAIKFTAAQPLPDELVHQTVELRLAEIRE